MGSEEKLRLRWMGDSVMYRGWWSGKMRIQLAAGNPVMWVQGMAVVCRGDGDRGAEYGGGV